MYAGLVAEEVEVRCQSEITYSQQGLHKYTSHMGKYTLRRVDIQYAIQ